LKRTGTVEILTEIGTGHRTFGDLEEAVLASSTTVSNRLQEGVAINLLEITYEATEHGSQKVYELTEAGLEAYQWAQEIGLDNTVGKRQRIERQLEQERQRWIDQVTDSKLVVMAHVEATTPSIEDVYGDTEFDRTDILEMDSDELEEKFGSEKDEIRRSLLEANLISGDDDGSEGNEARDEDNHR
jgi:DNA-binding HxlR family transcriptional regulator